MISRCSQIYYWVILLLVCSMLTAHSQYRVVLVFRILINLVHYKRMLVLHSVI